MDEVNILAQKALSTLPRFGVRHVRAYGSRYLENKKTSQLDLLIAVESSLLQEWHDANFSLNPKHYFLHSIPNISKKLAMELQTSFPPIFYHSNIPIPSADESGPVNYFKYGIIDTKVLTSTLESWDSFFIAGRFQKPTLKIEFDHDESIKDIIEDYDDRLFLAMNANLSAALSCALLLLPEEFSEADLYFTLSSLSYIGDIRNLFGAEDPNKVENIVFKSFDKFRDLYQFQLDDFIENNYIEPIKTNKDKEQKPLQFRQVLSKRESHTKAHLPFIFQKQVVDIREHVDNTHDAVKYVLYHNNRKESIQMLKNLSLMNNPLKSMKYVAAKFAKRFLK